MSQGSTAHWITEIRDGDDRAIQRLWEEYYQRLIVLVRRKLSAAPRRIADEEDAVLSAFDSFCRRAGEGQFPNLKDRDDLWRLLVTISARKALAQVKHQQRQKRGGGRVAGESVFAAAPGEHGNGIAQVVGSEPTPEFAADVAESLDRLFESLDDETARTIAFWKLEGWTNEEMASHLDCSLSTVERKLRLIRQHWSEDLDGE